MPSIHLIPVLARPFGARWKSANEIMDAVVDAVCPHDGTQDVESAREAVNEALTELLTDSPTPISST